MAALAFMLVWDSIFRRSYLLWLSPFAVTTDDPELITLQGIPRAVYLLDRNHFWEEKG